MPPKVSRWEELAFLLRLHLGHAIKSSRLGLLLLAYATIALLLAFLSRKVQSAFVIYASSSSVLILTTALLYVSPLAHSQSKDIDTWRGGLAYTPVAWTLAESSIYFLFSLLFLLLYTAILYGVAGGGSATLNAVKFWWSTSLCLFGNGSMALLVAAIFQEDQVVCSSP